MGNQTQIPVIQTPDSSMTQIQQNANKVLRNIYNQLSNIEVMVGLNTRIGDIQLSAFDLTTFQELAGDDWIEANGQSCVNTTYQSISGNNTVPTVTVAGTNAYIKVN